MQITRGGIEILAFSALTGLNEGQTRRRLVFPLAGLCKKRRLENHPLHRRRAATSAERACAPLVVMHSAAVRCHDSVSEAVSRRRALAVNGSAYHDGGRDGGAEGGRGEGIGGKGRASPSPQLL